MDYEYYRREETSDDGQKKVEEAKEPTLPGMGKGFWQRNGATVITLAILGLIIGGAIAVNERRAGNTAGDEAATDIARNAEKNQEPNAPAPEPAPRVGVIGGGTVSPRPASPSAPKPAIGVLRADSGIRITETVIGNTKVESFEVTAFRGNGRTHLARRAITEQLRRTDTNLSNEQRVYAEDYLQKHFAPKVNLHPGDKLTFTSDQINQAVSASQSLTSAQLQNLHQYSIHVSWPPI